jgi:hypothetical protein
VEKHIENTFIPDTSINNNANPIHTLMNINLSEHQSKSPNSIYKTSKHHLTTHPNYTNISSTQQKCGEKPKHLSTKQYNIRTVKLLHS